jgi:hypothetical protein
MGYNPLPTLLGNLANIDFFLSFFSLLFKIFRDAWVEHMILAIIMIC